MPFAPFYELFPEVARRETRVLHVYEPNDLRLAVGSYHFLELFCDERGCDCRRVFFHVTASFRRGPEAVIAWGWESRAFYARWMRDDDPTVLDSLRGPELNVGSPRTELAEPLLAALRDLLATDDDYVARIRAHYRQYRARVDRAGGHPSDSRRSPVDRARDRPVP